MLGGIHAYIRTHNTHISIVFCCSSYAHDKCPCQSCQGDSCLQLCILWGFRICRRIFPLKTNQVRGLHTSCTYNYIPLHCVILVVHLYLILHRIVMTHAASKMTLFVLPKHLSRRCWMCACHRQTIDIRTIFNMLHIS